MSKQVRVGVHVRSQREVKSVGSVALQIPRRGNCEGEEELVLLGDARAFEGQ